MNNRKSEKWRYPLHLIVFLLVFSMSSMPDKIFPRPADQNNDISASAFSAQDEEAQVIHVPGDQPTIQAGIDAAFDGYTVRVADGTYSGPGNRDLNFNGKAIIVESANGPDFCILDCESAGRGFYFNNREGENSVLDGFTILNGYADGPEYEDKFGGGIYCWHASPTIRNNIITGNVGSWGGGGIYCTELSHPMIRNNMIHDNAARTGGGIYCRASSSPTLLNNRVTGNTAGLRGGGFLFSTGASPVIINNLVTHNTARYGGGIHSRENASPVMANCTITQNEAGEIGGAILCNESTMEITNAIIWVNIPDIIYVVTGQVFVSYSDILGGYAGTGNINTDPLFVPGLEGNYYLSQIAAGQEADSPCVDSGDPASGLLDGTTRTDLVPDSQIIDMGYHYPHGEGLYICSRPSSLNFKGISPDVSPADQMVEIWRCGTGILEWSLSSNAPWLTVSPASGISTGEMDEVTISVDTDGMTAGAYHAAITIDAADAVNAPVLIPVLLVLDYTAVVAGPGPGYDNPPHVRAFQPEPDAQYRYEFGAYGPRHYGVNVSCGDVTGDHFDEMITGAGPGAVFGPHVRGFGRDTSPLPGLNFMAYGTRKYGVNVASGDLDGDGYGEIITGAGPGAVFGPHVRAFNYDDSASITPVPGVSFMAYGTRLWGVNVSGGDIDGDGFGEIITGPGPGSVFSPHVRGWNVDGGPVSAIPGISFLAYRTSKYGCIVSCGDVDGDGFDEIVTAPGPSLKFGSHIGGWNYDGTAITPLAGYSFFAWPPSHVRYGARIFAGADLNRDGKDELVVGAGPDPYITSPVKAFRYEGMGMIELFSLEAFPSSWTHGVNVAAGRL